MICSGFCAVQLVGACRKSSLTAIKSSLVPDKGIHRLIMIMIGADQRVPQDQLRRPLHQQTGLIVAVLASLLFKYALAPGGSKYSFWYGLGFRCASPFKSQWHPKLAIAAKRFEGASTMSLDD